MRKKRKNGIFKRLLNVIFIAALVVGAVKGLGFVKNNYDISLVKNEKKTSHKLLDWNFDARRITDDSEWLKAEYPEGTPEPILKGLFGKLSFKKIKDSVENTNIKETVGEVINSFEGKNAKEIVTSGFDSLYSKLGGDAQPVENNGNTTLPTSISEPVKEKTYLANAPSYYSNLEMATVDNIDFGKFFEKTGFVVYYNIEHKNPEFVCYELTKEELTAKTKRSDEFHNEDDFHNKYMGAVATLNDYKKSGYDRGHNCPSASVLFSEQANFDSFSMVNMSPQKNRFNGKLNLKAENAERDAARQFEKIYCVTGPLLKGIDLNNRKTIGNGVTVPDYFFKAWLVFDKNGDAHTLAVLMPQEYTDGNLKPYFVTVNKLEEITGLDFFFNLDDSIEEQAEDSYNLSLWPASFK